MNLLIEGLMSESNPSSGNRGGSGGGGGGLGLGYPNRAQSGSIAPSPLRHDSLGSLNHHQMMPMQRGERGGSGGTVSDASEAIGRGRSAVVRGDISEGGSDGRRVRYNGAGGGQ